MPYRKPEPKNLLRAHHKPNDRVRILHRPWVRSIYKPLDGVTGWVEKELWHEFDEKFKVQFVLVKISREDILPEIRDAQLRDEGTLWVDGEDLESVWQTGP